MKGELTFIVVFCSTNILIWRRVSFTVRQQYFENWDNVFENIESLC